MESKFKELDMLFGYSTILVLCLYLVSRVEPLKNALVLQNDALEGAFITIPVSDYLPDVSFLDLCGSLLCCAEYRNKMKAGRPWWHVLLGCTMLQFGGTTLTGVVLGQTPSWIVSQRAFPALFLAWWLTFFSPYDLYWCWTLRYTKFHAILFGTFASISSSHATTSWGMDKALFNKFHLNADAIGMSTLTCLACGTLSACGGGLMSDMFQILDDSPPFLRTATFNKSFILASIYYTLVKTSPKTGIPFNAAKCILTGINVSFFWVRQVIDPSFDCFSTISEVLLSILGVNVTVMRNEMVAPRSG